ncbi:MAG TPA: DUF423 domain-containing protein [Rhodanobacteraceae bacterium]|nr:DUF423 domain-containing protein [Rhodanobacteraceae bacterium]
MKPANAWAAIVATAGATAVLLGAFGAHALSGRLGAPAMSIWHTAVDYQFWHALALALAAFAAPSGRARDVALRAFGLGIVLFSGSLYALALGAPRWIGAITPLGGLALIVGWVALGLALTARAQR